MGTTIRNTPEVAAFIQAVANTSKTFTRHDSSSSIGSVSNVSYTHDDQTESPELTPSPRKSSQAHTTGTVKTPEGTGYNAGSFVSVKL